MRKILAVILMLSFGLVSLNAYENTPKGVVEAFCKALADNNIDKAITFMDKKRFRSMSGRDTRKEDARAIVRDDGADLTQYQFQVEEEKNKDLWLGANNQFPRFNIIVKNETSPNDEEKNGMKWYFYVKQINGKWLITATLT